jgi:septum formation protein
VYCERLAHEKALAVFQSRPHDHVLGADTIVVVDNQILGKPRDSEEGARMLRMLSGRMHTVITGVCLIAPETEVQGRDSTIKTSSESTLVTMAELSDGEIRDYIATGEPMDKAGAYAIQGIASRWIPRIEGDYSNVVGLPLALAYAMLKSAGVWK